MKTYPIPGRYSRRYGRARDEGPDTSVRTSCDPLVESLPPARTADVLGRQLLRSATSVGVNYRAARRAKSTADFISKLATVEEEVDQCGYWIDLLGASGIVKPARLASLADESKEITAIVVATIKTAKAKLGSRGRA